MADSLDSRKWTEVVGKIGRAESALDPAPVSMVETVINVQAGVPRSMLAEGRILRFAYDEERRRSSCSMTRHELIPDPKMAGPSAHWREEIQSTCWTSGSEIEVAAAQVPGHDDGLDAAADRNAAHHAARPGCGRRWESRCYGPETCRVHRDRCALRSRATAEGECRAIRPETVRGGPASSASLILRSIIDREALARYGLSVRARPGRHRGCDWRQAADHHGGGA